MSSHHKDISYLIRTANKYYNINVDEPFTVDDVIDEVRSRGMSLDLFKKF